MGLAGKGSDEEAAFCESIETVPLDRLAETPARALAIGFHLRSSNKLALRP